MNTRGLTELVALNVVLTDGIIGKRLFSVFVLMALITTLATSPLLSLIRLPMTAAPELRRLPAAQPPSGADES